MEKSNNKIWLIGVLLIVSSFFAGIGAYAYAVHVAVVVNTEKVLTLEKRADKTDDKLDEILKSVQRIEVNMEDKENREKKK